MKKILFALMILVSFHAKAEKGDDDVVGCWLIPGMTDEYIHFNPDGRFMLQDYNKKLGDYEIVTGHWEIQKKKLILSFEDRPQEIFALKKNKKTLLLNRPDGFDFSKADAKQCVSNTY